MCSSDLALYLGSLYSLGFLACLLLLLLLVLIPSGIATTSILENTKSTHKANIHAGIAPAKIIVLFTVCTPENTKYPSPPAPTNADKVIRPTADTADILTPAIIIGSASGR